MPPVGPQLPPHLQNKRKRDGAESRSSDSSSDDEGPALPPADAAAKKRRVMGPAPPPAPLEEKPPESPSGGESSSDEDSDYGPAMPGTAGAKSAFDDPKYATTKKIDEKPKHEEWMMMPPTQDGLASRMDPTKLRARGFNTGRAGRTGGNGGDDNSAWFETPEEKRKRLEDQVLGVGGKASSAKPEDLQSKARKARDEEKARNIQRHNEQHRTQSLVEQHKGGAKKDEEADDDPTQRAFDWEKDMSSGARISGTQKREMFKRASDMGSRFSKGSYL